MARTSDRSPGDRRDAVDKVTGRARYAGDLSRPGMLWGAVQRSPFPHARILSIDTAEARALPGVHAVLVGSDIPADVRVGRNMRDMPVLAREKVRFVGEKVAAVAAETRQIAEDAARLVRVEYDELPAVLDPLEATQPGAPLIHDPATVRAWAVGAQVVPDYPNGVSAPTWGATREEVERALANADHVFEHTFRTPIQHQGYLETHACLVELDDRDVAHVWATNKAPLLLAKYLQEGLGLGRDQVAFHLLPLGGDFGGKGSFMDIPLAYFLAKATGRPVKMQMRYEDELLAGAPRHSAVLTIRTGVNRDGAIVARMATGTFASGGYAAFKPSPDSTLPGFKRGVGGPYHVPVFRAELHMVYTNTVPGGHMRAPGEVQATYALECHTDLVARALGLDPVAFRLKNATHHPRRAEGDPDTLIPPRAQEVLERAAEAIGLHQPRPAGVGRGVSLMEMFTSPGVYGAILRVDRDGLFTLQTPIVEQGAGMLTIFTRILANELGIPSDEVRVEQGVDGIEEDRGIGGSRATRMVGKLLQQLSRQVRARLATLLASELGLDPALLQPVPGGFRTPQGETVSYARVAALAPEPLVENVLFRATAQDTGTVFLAQAVEVTVDAETGAVKPTRIVSVHEVGQVVNPLFFKRQIEGGLLQGLGFALMEELALDEGRPTNLNLHEYKIPSVADAPSVEAILLEPDLRLGFTPVGEGPTAGVAPAVVNALVDVVGPHAFDAPLSPDVVRHVAAQSQPVLA